MFEYLTYYVVGFSLLLFSVLLGSLKFKTSKFWNFVFVASVSTSELLLMLPITGLAAPYTESPLEAQLGLIFFLLSAFIIWAIYLKKNLPELRRERAKQLKK